MEQNMVVHHSSGKNYRPKGFNGKKAFQIALLLAVCIWLMYQIKQYSHGNHKSYGENTLNKLPKQHESVLLGRKGNLGFIVGSSIVFEDGNRDNEFERSIEEKEDEVKQKRQHIEVLSNGKEAEESPSNGLEGIKKESTKTKEDNAETQVRDKDEKMSFDEEEEGEEKIVLQISEAESTNNPGQAEIGYEVHGFHDENGVPSDGLDHVNSTPYESIRDGPEKSMHHQIILSSKDQSISIEKAVLADEEYVDSSQGSHERNDTETSTGNTILRREQVEIQEHDNAYDVEIESKSNLQGLKIHENSGAKVDPEADANLDTDLS